MYGDHVYHRSGVSIGTVIYLLIGVVLAINHGYFGQPMTLSSLLSGILAILLWPLLLFGVNLHITLGA